MAKWPRTLQPETKGPARDRALRGCSIVWTRPAESAGAMAEALAKAGAEVHEAPAIEFVSLVNKNLRELGKSINALLKREGWLILPSPAAIRFFTQALEQLRLSPARLAPLRIAAIGPASAGQLAAAGLSAHFLPPWPNGRSLSETLPAEPGSPVLISGSSQTRPELREGLAARGLRVSVLPLYTPRASAAGLRAIHQLLAERPERLVVVTSPSAAEALRRFFDHALVDKATLLDKAQWVAIGPTTFQKLREWNILAPADVAQAATPDARGIIQAAAALGQAGPPES